MIGQQTNLIKKSDKAQQMYGSMNSEERIKEAADNDPERQNTDHQDKRRRIGSPTLNSRRLSGKSITFSFPTNGQAQGHAEEHHGKDSWQHKVLVWLHSSKVEYTLMGLLLLDVLILFVELFLLALFPACDLVERDAISCCPSSGEEHYRFLAEESHHYCPVGLEASMEYPAGCDDHKWSSVHMAEQALFILTAVILSIFFVELNITMIALTPSVFFRQFFFLADYIIISFGLALEVLLHFTSSATSQSLVGLLVTVRLWRFLRISHGLVEVTHEVAEKEFEELLAYTEELESVLRKNNIIISGSEKIQKIKHEGTGDGILSDIAKHHRSKHTYVTYPGEHGKSADDSER
ncbi:hypothetical protein FisN_2Hh168 [Fistulifera solaris]|jgi:hypothetical protein|uniref:Voltage-gated hydrogen channel 1 n=1 Tax=Fistulifera solaris TaxID=1519565 RepID=A0A1Z5KTG6_FISSO|nr:hypothetical protein FisN_2Hh168 [Fistulifera solaris]|eukprot:GAX29609.1 hypothetical protein FisN_2Hh168 [Fistulifera solaris]